MRHMPKREDGFTLVELLVVILIIGILSAIAIPIFMNQRKVANDAMVESDLRNIATAIQTMPDNAKQISKTTVGTSDGTSMTKISYFSDGKLTSEEIPTSDKVWWTVTGDSSKYCIVGYHTNGKKHVRNSPLMFDSTAGGIGREGEACNPEDILGEDGQILATGNLIDDPLLAKINRVNSQAGSQNRFEPYFQAFWRTIEAQTPVGNKAIEITTASEELQQGMIFLQSQSESAQPVLKAGEKWTASVYVKGEAGKEFNVGYRVVNVNSGYVGEYGKSYIATGGWDRISYTHTSEPGHIGYYPSLQIKERSKTPGEQFLLAGPMLERSPVLNPFRAD